MNSQPTLEKPPTQSAATTGNVHQYQPSLAEPEPLSLKKILVPIDFSKISRNALTYAIPLARQFGAKISLLHVVEPLPYPSDMAYFPSGEIFPAAPLKADLETMAVGFVDPELLDQVLVKMGTPFEVIINVARESHSDLIVLTTHGYTGLKHVFMGSTAERVVRHAPCPVFVVRRREHDLT